MSNALSLLKETLQEGRTGGYSGRAYVMFWKSDGKDKFNVLRERSDGSRQGGSPAMGYHSNGIRSVVYARGDAVPFETMERMLGQL